MNIANPAAGAERNLNQAPRRVLSAYVRQSKEWRLKSIDQHPC